jgi:hypothetical protein
MHLSLVVHIGIKQQTHTTVREWKKQKHCVLKVWAGWVFRAYVLIQVGYKHNTLRLYCTQGTLIRSYKKEQHKVSAMHTAYKCTYLMLVVFSSILVIDRRIQERWHVHSRFTYVGLHTNSTHHTWVNIDLFSSAQGGWVYCKHLSRYTSAGMYVTPYE